MTTTTVSNLSGNADRSVEIEVMGSPYQQMLRNSNYRLKVPYSSLSQTIRSIGQRGGKILNVKVLSNLMSASTPEIAIAAAPAPAAPVVTPVAPVAPVVQEPVKQQAPNKNAKDRQGSRRKQR
jgi:phycocyanin-associated, rod